MAIELIQGNTPPARGRVQLGEQVRAAEQLQMIRLAHEQWAKSGEDAGALLYESLEWSTTSTSYGYAGAGGSDWDLSRWLPLVDLEIANDAGNSVIWVRGFVRNLDLRVEVLDPADYTILSSGVASAGSGAWAWVSQSLVLGTIPGAYVLRLAARRASFDTNGALRHFAAVARPTAASQIPGQP